MLNLPIEVTSRKLVWLDCDPGVDDAMAIFLASSSPAIELIGISTVHGNVSLENTTSNTLGLLKMAGIRNIPVYAGLSKALARPQDDNHTFHGSNGVGGVILPETKQKAITEDVFPEIIKRITSFLPRKIHYVSIGCLSNLALLLTNYPEIKESLQQVSIMGGAVNQGNLSPCAEFNIYKDPEAAKIVFSSGLNLTMCPLDLTLQVRVNADILSRLEAFGTQFSQNVITMLLYYRESYRSTYGYEYSPLHDPCAVYYIINPAEFQTKYLNVEIETKSEFCDGRTVADTFNITVRKPNCTVALSMNQELFWSEMMAAIATCNERSPINNNNNS